MAAFVFWQQANRNEPLVPLDIFRDRDFSLSTLGVATIGFVVTAMILPVMFYAQAVCGLSPTRSALLTAPMAIATGLLAPWVGRIVDRYHPRPIIGFGFSMLAISLTWLSVEMTPTTPIWRIVLPLTATGVGHGVHLVAAGGDRNAQSAAGVAGAGSGVYNATRQVGSVLGSAGMAAFMTTRISAEMPMAADGPGGEGSVTELPSFPARTVRRRDVAVAAAARVRRTVRCGRRDVPARLRRSSCRRRDRTPCRSGRRVLGRRRLRRRRPLRRVHRCTQCRSPLAARSAARACRVANAVRRGRG